MCFAPCCAKKFFHIFAVIVVVGHLCTMVFGGDVGNV
jgi:hypothetical protein